MALSTGADDDGQSLVRLVRPGRLVGAPLLRLGAIDRAGCVHPLARRGTGAELAEHALEDRRRQAIPTVGEGFEGQRGLIAGRAGM